MAQILTDIKKSLGIEADYKAFDDELIQHINSAIMFAETLGLPPFVISDDTQLWTEWLDTIVPNIEAVKGYLTLRVRLIFDPPQNSFITNAIEKQLEEYAWRINIQLETQGV